MRRPATASPALTRPSDSRVEVALQLLRHAGVAEPAGEPDSRDWLLGLIGELVDLSSRDALTGVANRRTFERAMARELDRVARSGESAMLLVLDIDHFKPVNDTYGHTAGDKVIKAVAAALLDCVRPMDLVARVGGEEFAVILPNCMPTFGAAVAERLRQSVAAMQVEIEPATPLAVTISVGGAFAPQWVRSNDQLWVERADQQLYRAKAHGRNRVCLEHAAISEVSSEEKQMLFDCSQFQDSE